MVWVAINGIGADSVTNSPILANLTFEQLSQIQITTATKRPETLASTPAAVYVLTGEELQRLGVTTFPDALRYVPGMETAMIDSSHWAVASRGFNGQFANQLLVMMDGRSLYSPAFGGVFWNVQDYLFSDIDRIEVVRGPGGALWGANAVNGVINIITKSAKETQGTIITGGGGSFNQGMVSARHGFQVSDQTFARVYAKFDQFGQTPMTFGGNSADDWNRLQGGFRLDSQPNDSATFTLQSDVHRTEQGFMSAFPSFTPPAFVSIESYRTTDLGANVLGRWTRHFTADSVLTAQAYYDYYENASFTLNQHLHTLDADLQHNFGWGERQQITWGAGYRVTLDTIKSARVMRVPGREQANDQLFSLFAQDEIALVQEKLFLTLGTKLEHNDYTGLEFSPSARLRWHPSNRQTVWGAVSRAVSNPGHLSSGFQYDARVVAPGALVQVQGRRDRVEELLAYELGYRIQPVDCVSVDVAGFYNDYSQLSVLKTGTFIPGAPPIVPVYMMNQIGGHTHGVEVALGWQALDQWRLQGNYTWFGSDVSIASLGRGDGGASPKHRFGVRSTVELGSYWEWDTGVRFVDRLQSQNVPSYVELDLRLAWKPTKHWELALVGQNLLHDSHYEFPRGLNSLQSEVSRSVYGKVTWKF